MNRRNLLQSLPFFGMAATLPVVATAQPKPVTAHERYMFHLAEMERAAQEIDPTLRFHRLGSKATDDRGRIVFGTIVTV